MPRPLNALRPWRLALLWALLAACGTPQSDDRLSPPTVSAADTRRCAIADHHGGLLREWLEEWRLALAIPGAVRVAGGGERGW
jgi:hypothetical protein